MQSSIEYIKEEYNPSYNPLTEALVKSGVDKDAWNAACSRVYSDGYYGPISDEEWRQTDGREPSNVKDAIKLIAKVLEKVDDYRDADKCVIVDAHEICKELVPFYGEIYGEAYPK